MNELDHVILQHMNAMSTLQNAMVPYVDLAKFEEIGRKFVIGDDIFSNKISGSRQSLVYLVYNSKVAFYSLIDTITFLPHIPSIFLTASIVKGPRF